MQSVTVNTFIMREEILMRKVFTMLTFLIIVLLLSLSPPDTAAMTAGRCSVSPSPPLPRITQKKTQCKLEAVVYCSSLATVSSYNSLATVSLYNSLATFLLYNSLVTVSLHNSLATVSSYNSLRAEAVLGRAGHDGVVTQAGAGHTPVG